MYVCPSAPIQAITSHTNIAEADSPFYIKDSQLAISGDSERISLDTAMFANHYNDERECEGGMSAQNTQGGRSEKSPIRMNSLPQSTQPHSFAESKATNSFSSATPTVNGAALAYLQFPGQLPNRNSLFVREAVQNADSHQLGSPAFPFLNVNTDFSPSHLQQQQDRNLESPWSTGQPCITDASATLSGAVPTRTPSARLNGFQQRSPGTIGSNINQTKKTSPSSALPSFLLSDQAINKFNQISPSSRLNQSVENLQSFAQYPSEYLPAPLINTHGRMPMAAALASSNSRFIDCLDGNVDHSDHNLMGSTDSSTNFGYGPHFSASEFSAPPVGRSSSVTYTGSSAYNRPSRESTQVSPQSESTHVRTGNLRQNPGWNFENRQISLIQDAPRTVPEGHHVINPAPAFQPNTLTDGSSPYSDRSFLSRYFGIDVGEGVANKVQEHGEWAPLTTINKLHIQAQAQLRNDLKLNRPNGQSIVSHAVRERSQLQQPAPSHGIDHYEGSPQITSRPKPNYNRHQATQQGHYHQQHLSAHHRACQQPAGTRCGESCQATKLELMDAHRRLLKIEQERDEMSQKLFESEQMRLAMDAELKKFKNISINVAGRSLDFPQTPLKSTRERLINLLQQQSYATVKTANDSRSSSPNVCNQHFKSEFDMLFSAIKSWTGRYLKFPSAGKYSAELFELLRLVAEEGNYAEALITQEKTKAIVIQALVSRFIIRDLWKPDFLESLKNFNDENEMAEICQKISDRFHSTLAPLLSRFSDNSIVEASSRSFLGIIQHAARLSVAMYEVPGGFQSWFFDFPRCNETFKTEYMEDAEKYSRKISASILESERSLVKLSATPLIARVVPGTPTEILYKATILIRSP